MFKEMINRDAFVAIIKEYGANYVDGNLSEAVVDEMLDAHVKGKEHIFKLFGNKLKIEKEIETTLSNEEINRVMGNLIRDFSTEKRLVFVTSLLRACSIEEFSTNKLNHTIRVYDIQLDAGMKLSKALARLCHPDDVHKVVTAHSMAIQQITAKGKAVISIDPIDYITMSSNNSGWRSCHRLNGGEYRTGPLAYLRDGASVICYVESSKPCIIRDRNRVEYEHSNKVWRQLAMVNPEANFSMQERHYPNRNTINETAISEMFLEAFSTLNGKEYKIERASCDLLNDLHIDYANQEDESRMYYNDIYEDMFPSSNIVIPSDMTGQELAQREDIARPIKGAAVYCLDCGYELSNPGSLYCNDCCSECDEEEW